MAIVKASREDWKWPAIFLLLGLLGAVAAALYFRQAFPEASIDLRLSRPEISSRAASWLRLRGLNPESFRESILFEPDDQAKTYLERELGAEQANRLMSSQVSVWRWKVRRFKPPQKEELLVRLDPAGALVGFQHIIEEDATGARLGKEEAQRLAEIFLRTQKGLSLDDYTLVQDELQSRPKRSDYTFTWERKGFRVKEASYRLAVTLQGDQVGQYREFLKVPEHWIRDYERLRARNDLLTWIATSFYIPLLIAAVFLLVKMARQKRVAWRPSLLIGAAVGLVFGTWIANMFPVLFLPMVPTNAPYFALWTLWLIVALLYAVVTGLFITLLAAVGGPLYADLVPGRVSLSKLFTLSGLRTKEFFFSTLIGYGMAALHLGAVVLFYMVARRFGAWAPQEIKYDNAISTALPWIYPLGVSVWAATSEEFSFRLFAIPLLQRWLKSRWLAIVIPAFIWGFLHSNYPQQPAWIRGVEVGLIGVLAGWVMLRFGILATLVWHYTVDAVMIGLFLLRSENLYYRMTGALVGDAVLIPLLISVVLYWQHGGFVEDETILNRPEPLAPAVAAAVGTPAVPVPAGAAVPAVAYAPLERRRRSVALAAGLSGLIVLGIARPARLGDFVRYVSRTQAEQTAVEHLRHAGVDAARFRHDTVAEQRLGGASPEYLRQTVGLAETNRIYSAGGPRLTRWRTRFYRPLEKEEYNVFLAPDGRDPRVSYTQDEGAAGASLEMPEAQARAGEFLKRRGVTLDDYNLVESKLEKRPARHDFTFIWEGKKPLAGEARQRIQVQLIGDRISGPQYPVKVPESWERDYTRLRLAPILLTVYFFLLCAAALALCGRRLGQASLRWKVCIGLGAAVAVAMLLNEALSFPSWAADYNTSVPWNNWVAQRLAFASMAAMGAFVGMMVLAIVADTLLSSRYGSLAILPAPGAARAACLREALLLGTCGALAISGVSQAADALSSMIPAPVSPLRVQEVVGLSGLWPAVAALVQVVSSTVWRVLLLAAAAGLALTWLKKTRWIAVALLATALVLALRGALTPLGFVRECIVWCTFLAAVAGLVWLLRFNVAAYLGLFGLISAADSLAALARHPGLRTDAWILGAVLAAAVVALFLWIRRESAHPTATGAAVSAS